MAKIKKYKNANANKVGECAMCGVIYNNYGNNAWPINDYRVCNDCNAYVVMARIQNVINSRQRKEA